MRRNSYVSCYLACAVGLSVTAIQAAQLENGQPHIILIMTDQQRSDALGGTGNEAVRSAQTHIRVSERVPLCVCFEWLVSRAF